LSKSSAGNGRARLGAHMSVDGGLHRAVERAERVGATALQIFVKSARQWRARRPGADQVRAFRERCEAAGLTPYTLAHAGYLINPAAPSPAVRERSVAALRDELARCDELGIPYLVLHPGSHVGAGEERGLQRAARALDRALDRRLAPRGRTTLLLEITAGQGSNLGHRFEHFAVLLEAMERSDRVGICFDTCHAVAAGYAFDDDATFGSTFDALDRSVGLGRLKAFHLNDSKFGLGSRRDRHEHIGRGAVGLGGFSRILNDPRLHGLPMVLETPKGPDLADDRRNLARLRRLLPAERR
jgi:deoxyribonuclease-4